MKGAPKPLPLAAKLARGTYRPDRDAHMVEIAVSNDPPLAPEYLTSEAAAVWEEDLGRATVAGVSEVDSSLFARYCSLEAMARRAFGLGEPVPAAYLSELRRTAELLGIAGPKSRTLRPAGSKSNPFARNGRRNDAGRNGR